MGDVAIRVENLSKLYHIGAQQQHDTLRDALVSTFRRGARREDKSKTDLWALKDVSFEVKRGEVVGVIGRNGAGKSTLLKILSRITEPTSGRVAIHGRVGSLLEVGTGFHPELTGRENIYLNGAILGMKRTEIAARFDEIVAFSEIERFLDTPVKRYSSGMYVRLAFAVAAHLEPEILLVDEVLAVGDAAFQKKCLGKMGDTAREGRAILFVSHNMGAISALCPSSVYLADGALTAFQDTTSIVASYMRDVTQRQAADLAALRLAGFGKDIRFTSIRFCTSDGMTTYSGQPLEFALSLESSVRLDGISIGASIFALNGNCVGTLITQQEFSAYPDQGLEVSLRVAGLNLAPGSYYAGFSIGRGGRHSARRDLDNIVGLPAFQVLPVPTEENWIAYWNPGWGNLVINDVDFMVSEQ